MTRSAGLIVGALVMALAGGGLLAAGLFDRRIAIAQEDMAVLDFADPAAEYAALERDLGGYRWVSGPALKEVRHRRAELQYWQRDYADLVEAAQSASQPDDENSIDPEIQAMAANAMFRIAQRGPQDRATLLRNLDSAARAYGEAIRLGADQPDVAFNYELVVRLRQEVAAGKRKLLTEQSGDPETDPNMLGDPGLPPPEMEAQQFQIRVPMDPRDMRQSQEQSAGTGAQRRRRG
jgi:hypothetical protein